VKAPYVLVPLVAVACQKAGPTASATSDASTTDGPSLTELRESARETLDVNCSECHTATLPTALPRALRVFDLTEIEWSRRMSDAQLLEAARRLREPMAPARGEAEVRPIRASDAERARFDSYVAKEIEARRGTPR
jgi:hypothetical protein